ncbi:DUF1573 domain-containing protein [Roseimarinus sediminis]|uniref:DUF1573 domain-containing protein n=1 Tax=Roseimarinus sediminis TaxID=1610899 RepID=UPI003D1BE9CF
MNKYLQIVCLLLFVVGCKYQGQQQVQIKKSEEGIPKFAVQPEIHNFGEIESGEILYYSFKVSNLGSGILSIDSIDAGCACIEAHWPEVKLLRGEQEYLQIVFNSAGEWGKVLKPIIVYSNGLPGRHEIFVGAKVNNQLFN